MSKRNYRRKRVQDSDEEGEEDSDEAKKVSEILQDRKELQKFRTRPNGVSAEALLETEPIDVGAGQDSVVNDDPFKLKSGGGLTETKATTGTQFGTTFSAETNQRGKICFFFRKSGLKDVSVKNMTVKKCDSTDQV